MTSVAPPDDESIKTLYAGGLDARVTEQDLRDHFYAHGEIESIRMVPQRACAFVMSTTREPAEKAAEELSNKLVVKGLHLKLMWGRPQAPKSDGEVPDDDATKQGHVTHGGMLPRAVLSQQQSSQQPQPPGMQDPNQQQPLHYFNIPAPPHAERAFYPSMDPQRMDALVPSQEASGSNSGSEKQPQQQGQPRAQNIPGHGYPMPQPHLQGHYPPYYQGYGYMAPPPPPYQHQYPPYTQMMAPPPPPPPAMQQYQHPVTPGSTSQN